jgi:hypothetical protein
LFDFICDRSASGRVWAVFAEAFFPLIYSVPTFLGVTLARSDSCSRPSLEDIWAEELGTKNNLSHPVLFEMLHRVATKRWGSFHQMHQYGIDTARQMISLCASGPWPFGVAAMLAHESQFPAAYSRILPRAREDLDSNALFFEVHSLADVEHTSHGRALLDDAVQRKIVTPERIRAAYDESTAILRHLADHTQEALRG